MKNGKSIKTTLLVLLMAIIIFIVPQNVKAYTIITKDNNKMNIPKYITDYAKDNINQVISTIVQDSDRYIDIHQNAKISIIKPYVIYNPLKQQDAIYFFPCANKGRIFAVLTIMNTSEGVSMHYGTDISAQLNEIDYVNTDYILFEYNQKLIAESANNQVVLDIISSEEFNYTKEEENTENWFYSQSYKEKYKIVNNKLKFLKKCEFVNLSAEDALNMKMKTSVSLHKPMGQYGYGMCWASSVATIVNYKKTMAVTPFEICNKLGISYNAGASIYTMQTALNKYGVSYTKIRDSILEWSVIKDNIDNNHPFIANLFCNDGVLSQHAIVICGYTSTKGIKYWDSRLNNENGAYDNTTYAKAGYNFLSISSHAYTWKTTLSKK